jgi:amidase
MADTATITRWGVEESARRAAAGEVSAAELVEASLTAIEERNGPLNAISVVLADQAREEAAARDDALSRGIEPGPLHGVPVVIKEELHVAGTVTTYGGRGNSTPATRDSEVVRRLRKAGAVVVAKSRMPEFGQWPFTESDAHGVTRNPWETHHTPGGSSGGTAVAVASGMVPFGMGGDGGGSIRIPSACCGLFGLKPQRGRVTTAPERHIWWALGTVGPLTRSVRDSAIVYDVIRGNEPTDLFTTMPAEPFTAAASREPERLRIGWSTKPVTLGVRPHRTHVRAVEETAILLAGLGHDVFEIDPKYPDPTALFTPQFLAGVRTEADAVEHFDRLERRTRETYRIGGWVRPTVIDWAVRETEKFAVKANRVFERCDVLLTPTVARRPQSTGQLHHAGTVRVALRSLPMIAYTGIWNLAGNPAASVPCGIAHDGLPTAVQLVGRTDDEATLFSLAAQIEQERPWPLLAGDPQP